MGMRITRVARSGRRRPLRGATRVGLTLTAVMANATAASAAPVTPVFGPGIEALAKYEGQTVCDPTVKAGTQSLVDLLRDAYPDIPNLGVTRPCDVGGQSEHKEGRAYDWGARADTAEGLAAGRDLLTWLFATDAAGNQYANARRLGIMYIIWDQHMWRAYDPVPTTDPATWPAYNGADPHTSHMHISLSIDGAFRQTSWYGARAATASPGIGYWLASTRGEVFNFAAPEQPRLGVVPNRPIVAIAAKGDGTGIWMTGGDGGIFALGKADFYGSTGNIVLNKPIVGMTPTPSGTGYRLVASDGGIFAYGDAPFYGSTGSIRLNKPIVGMATTPSGLGYWLVASDGGIFSYGDAPFYGSTGSIVLNKPIVGMAPSPTGKGYWMVASDGGVFSFGDAGSYGSTGSITIPAPMVGMRVSSTGKGYLLVTANGAVYPFGDATGAGNAVASGTTIAGIAPYMKPPSTRSTAASIGQDPTPPPLIAGQEEAGA